MKKTGWARKHQFNNRLTKMLKAHPEICFTREEIADYCEVDVSTIRKIENNAIRKIAKEKEVMKELWKILNFLHEVK